MTPALPWRAGTVGAAPSLDDAGHDDPRLDVRPAVIVCAWCRAFGHTHGAIRAPDSRRWHAVTHEYATALNRAGLASHGVCPECRRRARQQWR